MQTVATISALRQTLRDWRTQGLSVALVPTMGNLHAGHVRLVDEAKRQADRVVVSVFVNPTQFALGEDFTAYPHTPEEDAEKLRLIGADLLFRPEMATLYPRDPATMTYVEVPGLSAMLCGESRPSHFRGVATVVLKLFHLVQPDVALFGEKDYQQLAVIRRLVDDLDLPIRVQAAATVREPSGLALSSRNAYLTEQEKDHAALLYGNLAVAAQSLQDGNRNFAAIERERTAALSAYGFRVDYFAIRRQGDLSPPKPSDRQLVILVAARLGRARLIDNLSIIV